MGTKRKTITIIDNQDNSIKSQIKAGGFTNDSESLPSGDSTSVRM